MEFLCFTLPADVDPSRARRLVQGYRASLEARCGTAIDPNAWDDGARAALCDILVDRLAMYTMVHRVRPQRFLPRVVRTWGTLHRIFPWPLA